MANNNYMLTTIDNPYNPFNQFDEWLAYDVAHGYNTCIYLSKAVISSNELSEEEEESIIDDAVSEILKNNIFGIFTKIYENGEKSLI